MQIMMALLLIGFVVAVLCAILDWGKILREHFANNPVKGRVYIEVEEDLIKCDAKLISITREGQIFKYRWQGKNKVVVVPKSYPVHYCDGRRVIGVKGGHLVASRMAGQAVRDEPDAQTIAALVTSGIITDLIMALTSKGWPKWLWIVLGIAMLAAMVMMFKQCGGEAPLPGEGPINPETGEPFTYLLTMMGV